MPAVSADLWRELRSMAAIDRHRRAARPDDLDARAADTIPPGESDTVPPGLPRPDSRPR
jgi:hypothetical protein